MSKRFRIVASLAMILYGVSIAGCASDFQPPRAYLVAEETVDICTVWATDTQCFEQSRTELEREMERFNESMEMADQYRFED